MSLIAPHACTGCKREGYVLCPACARALPTAAGCCYVCGVRTSGGQRCTGCPGSLRAVHAATLYEGPAKEVVHRLKFEGAIAAAKDMAEAMAAVVPEGDWLLVPVPTASSRRRQRGYDQAVLIARELAHKTGLPVLRALRRHGQSRQVNASRKQRRNQLIGAYSLNRRWRAKYKHILLVDDVYTTGATLNEVGKLLSKAGAERIIGLTFAMSPPSGSRKA